MRIFRFSFYATGLLAMAFVYFLTCTSNGASLLLQSINSFTSTKITFSSIQGSLYRGLEVRKLSVETSQVNASIDELGMQWQVFGLLKGEINLPRIRLANTELVVLEGEASGSPESSIENIWLPAVNIDKLHIEYLVVTNQQGQQLMKLDTLKFGLLGASNKFSLQNVFFRNEKTTIYANGTLEFLEPYNTHAIVQLLAKFDTGPDISVDLNISGHQKKLIAKLGFRDNLNGDASIIIRDMLENPQWQAQLRLEKFKPKKFDNSLPDMTVDIAMSVTGDSSSLNGNAKSNILIALDQKKEPRSIDSELEFDASLADTGVQLNIEKMLISSNEGELELVGEYNHATRLIAFDANWEKLQFEVPDSSFLINSRGSLKFDGHPDDYRFQLNAEFAEMTGLPAVKLSLPGSGDLNGLNLKAATVNLLGGTLNANAGLSWNDEFVFRLGWKGDRINPGLHWREWPGDLSSQGEFRLKTAADTYSWELNNITSQGRLRDIPVSLSLSASSLTENEYIVDASLVYAKAKALIQGHISENLDLNWEINSADLSRVDPKITGRLQSKGKLTGSRDKPALKAIIEADTIRSPWGSAADLSADLKFDLSKDAKIALELSAKQLTYDEMTLEHLDINIAGQNSKHRFNIATALEDMHIEFDGEGKLVDEKWSATVAGMRIEHQVYKDWDAANTFFIAYDKGSLQLLKFCLTQAESLLCADGVYNHTEQAWDLNAEVRHLPLSMWQDKLPETVKLDGHLEMALQIKSDKNKSVSGSARLRLPEGNVKLAVNKELESELSLKQTFLNIELDNGDLSATGGVPEPGYGFEPITTNFQMKGISAADQAPETLAIEGTFKSAIRDLSNLSALIPQLLDVRGEADLDLSVSGSIARPVYDGLIKITDAGFSSSDLGIEVDGINFQGLKLSDDRYEISGELHSGNGELKLRALAAEIANSGPELNITLEGDRFELVNLPELWALVRPAIRGKVSLREQRYEGTIFVPAATINLDELAFASSVSEDEIIDNMEIVDETSRGIRSMNVRVELGEEVKLGGKGVSGNLAGAIDISTAKNGALIGDGEIAIRNGQFAAYGQALSIEEGRLLFNKSALDNPALRIVAVRPVDDFKVGVRIDGYTTAPQISLFSSTSLPQEQILSYIVFGRSLNSLSSSEGSDLLGAATSMGLKNSGFITDKVAARFGLDQISLSGSDAESASLIIGKYINPKLYLSYGLGIFDKISTARLKYDLSRRFSLEAERGAETAVDLFYKIDR